MRFSALPRNGRTNSEGKADKAGTESDTNLCSNQCLFLSRLVQMKVEVEIREAPKPLLADPQGQFGTQSALGAVTAGRAGAGGFAGGTTLPDLASLSPDALFRSYLEREKNGSGTVPEEVRRRGWEIATFFCGKLFPFPIEVVGDCVRIPRTVHCMYYKCEPWSLPLAWDPWSGLTLGGSGVGRRTWDVGCGAARMLICLSFHHLTSGVL